MDNNPITTIDPLGADGILIVSPDYEANDVPYTGHAGVLIWDNDIGVTKEKNIDGNH